jgi:membrane protein DedA with SNARE-associated domain
MRTIPTLRKRMVAIMRRMSETRHRLTDKQALGALGAYLVFRAITQRLGFAFGPRLLRSAPWAIPLLNNSMLLLIQTGVGTRGRPMSIVAAGAASVLLSMVAGLVLYWAGHRFGDKLAEMAARPGSPWAGVWNPKQIARAERWIDGWGLPVVFFGKVIEYFTVPVVLVAGATRMAIRRFLVAYTLGSIAFAALGLWIGGAAGRRWPWLDDWIAEVYGPWALRIGLGLIVVLVVVSLVARRRGGEPQPEAATTTPSQGASENEPPTS